MENILSLPVNQQNNILNPSIFKQIKWDAKEYANESGEDVGSYLLRDYDANPDGWNNCFEFSYDEISDQAKTERRNIVKEYLFL